MPTLKQKKNGDHIIHKYGDNHPVNTFQVTDEGAEIVLSSGCELEEYFPDQLFYLLNDLGHLSTTGEGGTGTGITGISNIDWAADELSTESRVEVAIQIVDKHGVDQLLHGDAAEWVLTIIDKPPVFLKPLVKEIAETAGYSYETIEDYSELLNASDELLETGLCAHLQMKGMRTTSFDTDQGSRSDRDVLGADGGFIHLKVSGGDTQRYGIKGEIPDSASDKLSSELSGVWGAGVGAAGLAALTSMEVERRYNVESGLVLPRERLEDFPVDIPPRSELTEQYEALRILQNHVNHVLESPDAGVEHGDDSFCDQWYQAIQQRLQDGSYGEAGLGEQQAERVDHSAQLYRDCYGDGDNITDFACILIGQLTESQQLRLFGFGIFDHGEDVKVPVAPKSGEPLPAYPQSQQELDHAIKLLSEFPAIPNTGTPT